MAGKNCLCGKAADWQQCCGRFLQGGERAKTAEQLMRSRFSAYVAGGYGDYLLKTWFPATAQGLTANELSQKTVDWCDLDVLAKSQQGDKAMVEFKAWYRVADDEAGEIRKGQRMAAMHEKSSFVRVGGQWLYVGGEVG